MIGASPGKVGPCEVVVSTDGLKAWLRLPGSGAGHVGPAPTGPGTSDVLAALEAANVVVDDEVRKRVAQWVALATPSKSAGRAEVPENYLVAEGVPAVEPEDAKLEWEPALVTGRPADPSDPVDYFAMRAISTVPAETVIGRLRPAREGRPGRDVHGRPIAPQRRAGTPLALGPGVRLGADGCTVIAEKAGRVVERNGQIRLDDVLQIPGDVNFDSGSIDACVDVTVKGTVRSHFHVRTTGALTVGAAVEAAEVEASGDVIIRGGLCGGGIAATARGRVRAGGRVGARFCNEAVIAAGGDVEIDKEILNSHVSTPARLVSPRGSIIGGDVWARAGLEIGVLGNDANVLTTVAVGPAVRVLAEVRRLDVQIQERLKSAALIREKVQPLLANLKRLTPAQREMATELMAKADEMEGGVAGLEARREQMLAEAQPPAPPVMIVHKSIYPGVHLRFGAREVHINAVVVGPVKVEERKVAGATEVVSVNELTGSLTVLPSADVDLNRLPADES